jgi:hypothetical protein
MEDLVLSKGVGVFVVLTNVPLAQLVQNDAFRRGRRPTRLDSLPMVARAEDHDYDRRVDGLTRVPIAEDLSIVCRID